MGQKDWVNDFFIYQAEGDVISVSIPTVVSKHEKKQWWQKDDMSTKNMSARNMSELKIMPHQSREAAGANNEKQGGSIFKMVPARGMKGIL